MSLHPRTLRSHFTAVAAVKYLNSDQLLTADQSGLIKLWKVSTRRVTYEFQAHSAAGVLSVEVLTHSDKQIIATQGRDSFVKMWELQPASVLLLCATISKSHTFCRMALQKWSTQAIEHQRYVTELQNTTRMLSKGTAQQLGPIAEGIFDRYNQEAIAPTGPAMLAAIPSEEETTVSLFDLRNLTCIKHMPLANDSAGARQGMCMCLCLFRYTTTVDGVWLAAGIYCKAGLFE
jgi:WD40 repeat protein